MKKKVVEWNGPEELALARIARHWTKGYCNKNSVCKVFAWALSLFEHLHLTVTTDHSQVFYCSTYYCILSQCWCLCQFFGCQSVYANRTMQSPVIWLTRVLLDSHIHHMMVLYFSIHRQWWSERWNSDGKKWHKGLCCKRVFNVQVLSILKDGRKGDTKCFVPGSMLIISGMLTVP